MFLFLADQISYRSYVYQQHFRLRSLASMYTLQQLYYFLIYPFFIYALSVWGLDL